MAKTDSLSPKQEVVSKLFHKTNSHLSIIWGYVQLIEQGLAQDSPEKEWIAKVTEECKEVEKCIGKFKKLANNS